MLPLLIQIVLLGIAAAMAPLPVILAIALLDTRRPVVNSLAYLAGGLVVYVVLILVGSAVVVQVEASLGRRHRMSTPGFILLAVVGAVFLLIAIVTWRSKRRLTIPARVEQVLESMGPYRAFGVGLLLCSPGFKNLALMAAALALIGAQGLDFLLTSLAMGLFLVITLSPPAAPLVTYLALPRERADAIIHGWNAWIEDHARIIVVIVSAAIGIILLQEGLSGLLA